MNKNKLSKPRKNGNELANGDTHNQKLNDATKLVKLVLDGDSELWQDLNDDVYITVWVDGHQEHYPLNGKSARFWLSHTYYSHFNRALNNQALQDSRASLAAEAMFNGGQRHEVHLRVAAVGETTYVDLGNADREVVEINAVGWEVKQSSEVPIRFRRPVGALALPRPTAGGNILQLRKFLHTCDRGFMFCVGWLISALSGRGPFPVSFLNGEHGTGKGFAGEVLRDLVDPNIARLLPPPKDVSGIRNVAFNHYVMAFDNMSYIDQQLSDGLCRVSTGAGFSDRQLYTDLDSITFRAIRPVIITGIPDSLGGPDLADRTLSSNFCFISSMQRETTADFNAKFELEASAILGSLFTAISGALRRLPYVVLSELPRMADFAHLIQAAEPYLPWNEGAFMKAYKDSRDDAAHAMVCNSPVGLFLQRAVGKHYEGTTSGLLLRLVNAAGDRRFDRTFPRNPESLSHALRRLAPALRSIGWHIQLDGHRRSIALSPPT